MKTLILWVFQLIFHLEENDILKGTMSATDAVDIVITYLEIFDEKSS